jgi:hypothetical protein
MVLVDYIGIFFLHVAILLATCCMFPIFLNLYFIYLYRCYSYIFVADQRRIIHIASSVVLQNAENVMSKSNIFEITGNPRKCKKKKVSGIFYGQL